MLVDIENYHTTIFLNENRIKYYLGDVFSKKFIQLEICKNLELLNGISYITSENISDIYNTNNAIQHSHNC